jgi:hypothetical protein
MENVGHFLPLNYVLRHQSEDEYLRQYRPDYEGYKFLADYPNSSPIVLSEAESFDFLSYQPVSQHYPLRDSLLFDLLAPLASEEPKHLAKALSTIGITHIVGKWSPIFNPAFEAGHLLPEFSSNGFTVYRLIPNGYNRSTLPVLDNGSFELTGNDFPVD